MEVSSGSPLQVQTEVIQKATQQQAQAVSDLLQDSSQQLQEQKQVQQASSANLTGLGGSLDLKA
jgi:hypothetical protein